MNDYYSLLLLIIVPLVALLLVITHRTATRREAVKKSMENHPTSLWTSSTTTMTVTSQPVTVPVYAKVSNGRIIHLVKESTLPTTTLFQCGDWVFTDPETIAFFSPGELFSFAGGDPAPIKPYQLKPLVYVDGPATCDRCK